MCEAKKSSCQKWWDEKTFLGLTRQDWSLLIVICILVITYFNLNWDWIFGLR